MGLLKRALTAIVISLVLPACGSTSADAESASGSGEKQASSDESSPAVGEETSAVLSIDEECRNGGSADAFGVEWFAFAALPAGWRDSAPEMKGVLRFESWELAVFEANGETARMTYSIEVVAECTLWDG